MTVKGLSLVKLLERALQRKEQVCQKKCFKTSADTYIGRLQVVVGGSIQSHATGVAYHFNWSCSGCSRDVSLAASEEQKRGDS